MGANGPWKVVKISLDIALLLSLATPFFSLDSDQRRDNHNLCQRHKATWVLWFYMTKERGFGGQQSMNTMKEPVEFQGSARGAFGLMEFRKEVRKFYVHSSPKETQV